MFVSQAGIWGGEVWLCVPSHCSIVGSGTENGMEDLAKLPGACL